MDFYENVKQLVKTNNLTLRSFIESLGINYDSYNSCKKYNNLPRADEAVKIAQALNTTVEYLVTGTSSSLTPSDIKQLDLYRKIPDDLKDIVTTLEEKLISKKGD
jgi:transcriptional regulator with XRE-family HTH domain